MKVLYQIKQTIKYIIYKPKYVFKTIKIKKNKKNIFLLNTPEHSNLGDHMIAFASLKYMNSIFNDYNLIEITYNQIIYAKNVLISKINTDNLLVIQGGGYLGDLWENEQKMFFDIIETFSENHVIVFPQTIYYSDKTKIENDRQKYSTFDNIIFFVRDRNSYDFMLNYNFVKKDRLFLIPDIALSLNLNDYKIKRNGILFCFRNDKEKNFYDKNIIKLLKFKNETIDYTDTVINHNVRISSREKELEKKLKEFAKYKLVITDRLHGMIFAYLTKTPCIAFDNVSKKVTGVYKWIQKSNCIECYNNFDSKIISDKIDYLLNIEEEDKYFENCNNTFELLEKEIIKILKYLDIQSNSISN